MLNLPSATTRVFLLDDHDIVRRGLRDLLAPARDIYVVGEAGDAQGAAETILELQAEVMVLDLHLQDGTGIEVCRRVRAADPSVRGLLLTAADDDEALVSAVLAGASGYAVKVTHNVDLISAVRRLGAGQSLLTPAATQRAAQLLDARGAGLVPALTSHQQDLLAWVHAGMTDAEIAERTGTPVAAKAAEIAELVTRVGGSASSSSPHPLRGAGRHRREVP